MSQREDLISALIDGSWLVETARGRILQSWGMQSGGAFERADMIAAIGDALPSALAGEHTAWMTSVVGSTRLEVGLGPIALDRLGAWTNVYVGDRVADPERFRLLGETTDLPVPSFASITRDEATLPLLLPVPGRRFVILTDLHMGARATTELLEAAVAEIRELQPEFVVVAGDITDDGEPEQFAAAAQLLAQLDCPVHCTLGNHDAIRRSTVAHEGHDLFAAAFGHAPIDVVLECGELQIALLDSTDPVPSPFPDWDLARGGFRDDAGGTNGGMLTEQQLNAVASGLDPDRPSLLVLHHELQPFAGFPPVMFGVRTADSRALADALDVHDIVGVVAGHTHRSALGAVEDRWPQLELPALKDWPHAYTVITVHGRSVDATVHQLRDSDLVWRLAGTMTPLQRRYVLGPSARLHHTFG